MLDILRQRRSVRQYLPRPLTEDQFDQLKEAVLRSPSSRGLCPWEFIFVTDKNLLGQLAAAKAQHGHFLRDAALGVVVLGDEAKADTWIEDCSIASIILHLTAHSLGLGSCWIQIRLREHQPGVTAEENVRQILKIPPRLRVESIISIGHPAKTALPHPRSSLQDQLVKMNTYA